MTRERRPEDLHHTFRMTVAEFAPVYQRLEEKGCIADYTDDPTYQWKDLKDEADEILREMGVDVKPRPSGGRKPMQLRESFEIPLSDYSRDRAAALSEALATEAASYPAIRQFREKVLGSQLLSSEQARDFVTSPAVRFFWLSWFRKWGIPVVGHSARVSATHRRVPGFDNATLAGVMNGFRPDRHRFYTVQVEPPGTERSVLFAPDEFVTVPEGLSVDEGYYIGDPEDEFMRPSPEKRLRYFGQDGIRESTMLPYSLLDGLRQLADLLAGRYRWSQEEATQFILTGDTPQVEPLKVSANLLTGDPNSAPVWDIRMEVAPWVPVGEVEAAYRTIQQQTLRGDSGKEHLSRKKIELFRFVKQRTEGEKEPDWQELLDSWNQRHDESHSWHYKETKEPRHQRANFKRDFKDAERVLLNPEHRFPQRKVTTTLEHWQERDLHKRKAAAKRKNSHMVAYLEGLADD